MREKVSALQKFKDKLERDEVYGIPNEIQAELDAQLSEQQLHTTREMAPTAMLHSGSEPGPRAE